MIFCIIVALLFVAFAPGLWWLSIPICAAYLILKAVLQEKFGDKSDGKDDCDAPFTEYDEFDWWQDNRGL